MTTSFGARIPRVEDAELVAGLGRFVDDLEPEGLLHLAIVRSDVAHADITDIDPGSAPRMPGVVRVVTHADLDGVSWPQLLPGLPDRIPLAAGEVRYFGEPIVAVLAEGVHAAHDARDDVWVALDERPAAITPAQALSSDAPLVYDELDSNVVYRSGGPPVDGLMDDADVVVARTFRNHRIAPGMLEPRGILVIPDGDRLLVHCSHQSPHRLRDVLAASLGIDPEGVRVVVPEVGGGFGAKATFYPEYPLAAFLALDSGRPVKFVETRSENLAVCSHGRGQDTTVELGATRQGRIVGLRFRSVGDFGAAVENQRWCLHATERMITGCYDIPAVEREIVGVLTNTAPVGAFRGAGRPEAAYALERAVDHLSRALDMDPADLRRRNFVDPDAFPHETPVGSVYDSGSYRVTLDLALGRAGYDELRAEQRRHPDRLLGVGIASYVELAAAGQEFGQVSISRDGRATVFTGTSPHGQGHRTAWAQIAADRLGLPIGLIDVVHGDTDRVPHGGGTAGSRSAVLGGTAVAIASEAAADRLRRLASEHLEAAPEDIRLTDGRAVVAGTDVGIAIADLVGRHGSDISESTDFVTPGLTYPFGTHVCALEIDPTTGTIEILEYIAVDDCGTVINPIITEGQVHGGIVQGVSHALREVVRYDDRGTLSTGNWITYPIPSISQTIPIDSARTETPSPNNPLGLKGVGESGTTGSTPAVANAVFDALARHGIEEDDLPMPYTPDRVWRVVSMVTAP